MGVATGDIHNDGWVDVYVTNFGSNQLFLNQADGSFRDVTDSSGTQNRWWSTSATFLDYVRTAGGSVRGQLRQIRSSASLLRPQQRPEYCGPQAFESELDRLFRNRGDGTFEDLTTTSGLREETGPGLGVVAMDFDADGWIDLYVTNDGASNQLWINQKNRDSATKPCWPERL